MGIPELVVPAVRRLPVLIVGAGLGGFTAALSLHRAGIRSNIITKESKFTDLAPSTVFLGGSAIRILDRLGLGSEYRSLGAPIHFIEIEDSKARSILSIRLNDLGTEIWAVPRANLQHIMLESLPTDSVHFNTKFRTLHCEGSEVHVKAHAGQDRSAAHPETFEANFVVGADGNNSNVRTFMSRSAMTVPSGVYVWRAVVQNRDIAQFPFHVGKEFWGGEKRFGYARMSPHEVVWWAVISNFHEILLRPFTSRLLREFEGFPKTVEELISSVESDRVILRNEMKHVWPEEVPWVDSHSSRIALVGDAGRPGYFGNLHSGHSFAVEDSYFLAHYLAEQNERGLLKTRPELDGYAEDRGQRMDALRTNLNRFNRFSSSQSRVRHYFTKKLLQASAHRLILDGSVSTIPLTVSKHPTV